MYFSYLMSVVCTCRSAACNSASIEGKGLSSVPLHSAFLLPLIIELLSVEPSTIINNNNNNNNNNDNNNNNNDNNNNNNNNNDNNNNSNSSTFCVTFSCVFVILIIQ